MCEGCVCERECVCEGWVCEQRSYIVFYGFRCGWHALISVKWACCQSLYILSLLVVIY